LPLNWIPCFRPQAPGAAHPGRLAFLA